METSAPEQAVQNVAVFAADLATSCRILPLLPPITPNVKSLIPPNPLEFRCRPRSPSKAKSKSGKNGNVDQSSQLSPSSVTLHCLPFLRSSVVVLVSLPHSVRSPFLDPASSPVLYSYPT